jgi:hypothetical protein
MRKIQNLIALLLSAGCLVAYGQIQRTTRPIGDAVSKALAKGALTVDGARPFHIRVMSGKYTPHG